MARPVAAAAIVALSLTAAGCGTETSERDARASVQRFYAAFEADDGAAACERLTEDASSALEASERRPCDEAVLSLELTPSAIADASVWVTSAQVALRSGDTAFLDQVAGGDWRIGAVGCHRLPSRPYECELDG